MGDLHRDLFVVAEQRWRLVLAVIDQRIVQPAKARSRIQRDIGEPVLLDQIDDDIRLPPLIGLLDMGIVLLRGFAHSDCLLGFNLGKKRTVRLLVIRKTMNPSRPVTGALLSGGETEGKILDCRDEADGFD
jgi:hypothetical protein